MDKRGGCSFGEREATLSDCRLSALPKQTNSRMGMSGGGGDVRGDCWIVSGWGGWVGDDRRVSEYLCTASLACIGLSVCVLSQPPFPFRAGLACSANVSSAIFLYIYSDFTSL